MLIILGLVLFNGVLAGSEIAVVSLRKTRLKELRRVAAARSPIEKLRDKPESFLATVQVGITIVSATPSLPSESGAWTS